MNDSLRTEVLALLRQSFPETLRLNELSKALYIPSDDDRYQVLRDTLNSLVGEGIVYRSSRRRYSLAGHTETSFEGTLAMHGYNGVVQTASPHFPAIHIRRPHLWTALHGDKVRVKLLAFDKDEKCNGEIVQVLERNNSTIVGKIDYDGDFYFLIPDEDRVHVDFLIHPRRLNGAKDGDKAVIKLIRWKDPFKSPEGEVVEVLGRAGQPRVEFASIAKEFRLEVAFKPEVEQQAERVAQKVSTAEIRRRLDLRKADIITIDPDDARDFDDALSLENLPNGNTRLGVHIADVSHYVEEATPLDREAGHRGNSVYLVDGVIPMLPEKLSNEICSLMPGRTRLSYSVFMEISPRGAVKNYEIRETVIKSKKRFTYNEAQQILDGGRKHKFADLIMRLHTLAEVLRKKRFRKGGIDFETTEVKFVLDENKQPVKAMLKSRTDSTSLVEECMLLANQTVAEHIANISPGGRAGKKRLLPFLYRIHDVPDREKLREALEFMRAIGLDVPRDDVSSREVNQLMKQVADRPEKYAINQVMLRAMSKAVYSDYNIGHYGLGFKAYSHFTSPIRRYPDLVIHRLLKEYARELPNRERLDYLNDQLDITADHCSAREALAVEAERASVKLTQVALAQDKIGEVYNGSVTGVTNFGMFVMIDELYAEGLLRMRDMDDDYYFFDEKRYCMTGRRTHKTFRIGTRVRVRIVKVNIEKREIDYKYLGDERGPDVAADLPEADEQVDSARKLAEHISRKNRSGRKGSGRGKRQGKQARQDNGNSSGGRPSGSSKRKGGRKRRR